MQKLISCVRHLRVTYQLCLTQAYEVLLSGVG